MEKEFIYNCGKVEDNWIFADLHIHSKYSRACSKDLSFENLVKWARIKGLGLLGTGDFTHPTWLKEIKEKLKEKKPYCLCHAVPFFWAHIMTNGDVYSCGNFLGDKEFNLGNFNKNSFKDSDCVVIVTDHSNVDYKFIAENSELIVDTRNVMKNVKSRANIVRL